MVRFILFDDEIVLFWDKQPLVDGQFYRVYCDGKAVGETDKTHYTLTNLQPERAYACQVNIVEQGTKERVFYQHTHTTQKRKKRLDITQAPYSVVGDGKTLCTEILQRAIDDCDKDTELYIPKGTYVTGALYLHSDFSLRMEDGAILQGSDNVEQYLPMLKSRFEGYEMYCYASLLNMGLMDHTAGTSCKNVIVRGGKISGGGLPLAETMLKTALWGAVDRGEITAEHARELETTKADEYYTYGRVRSRLVNISNAENVVLAGVVFENSASWNVHMVYSRDITTLGCQFYSRGIFNGDGWDPDSSENCVIFDCDFYTADDCIAIKSGKNPEGNRINRPCSEIRIFDCRCKSGHGVTIGSEMSGGVTGVHIWDCDLANAYFGVEIKGTKKRGGYVRCVRVENCKLTRVMIHSVDYNDDGVGAEVPPVFEDCTFKDLHLTGRVVDFKGVIAYCPAIELQGFAVPGYEVKNILFKNLTIEACGRDFPHLINMRDCKAVEFDNVFYK